MVFTEAQLAGFVSSGLSPFTCLLMTQVLIAEAGRQGCIYAGFQARCWLARQSRTSSRRCSSPPARNGAAAASMAAACAAVPAEHRARGKSRRLLHQHWRRALLTTAITADKHVHP